MKQQGREGPKGKGRPGSQRREYRYVAVAIAAFVVCEDVPSAFVTTIVIVSPISTSCELRM